MRSNIDSQKIEQLMKALGREARGSGCIYFTGGASALLIGWRSSTVDIDIRLDPEPLLLNFHPRQHYVGLLITYHCERK